VLPTAPVLARHLLNDVEQIGEWFILALDDVHLIQEQAVLDFLSELLRHPSPSMSLVLIGRRDPPLPIASLRAHRQVTEIRAGDLRFTPQEAAQLLGHVLRREIDQATAAEWTERMEGWVTGLLLAALSLRHRAQGDGFHLAVPAHSRYLQEYLLTEVLAHLPPGRRDWLLLASLLDRFCAPLCEAVGQSGQAAGAAGLTGIEFLRWWHEDNLFLVPLDDRSQWFRFHHLFQQLLQDRLQEHLAPQEIAAAHRRASRWLAAEGLVEEALQHALEAGHVQAAVDLVVQQRYDLMNRDQWRQLKRWLDLLPPEAVARDPLLLCAQALWAIHDGAFDVIVSSVQRAQQLVGDLDPGDPPREIAQAEIVVIEALLGLAGPQNAETLERCRSALGVLPRQALHIRSLAIFITLLSQQMLGDMQGAVTTSKEALAQQPWPDAYRAKMMHYLCLAHIQEGDWLRVLGAAPTGLKTAEKSLAPEPLNWCRCDLGTAHYLRGEFEQAEPYLLALLEDRYVAPAGYLAQGGFLLALLYLGQDRNTEAAQTIEYLEATFQETKDSPNLALAAAFQVEIALREGRLAQAHALGGSLEFDLIPPHWQFYVPQLTPIKLLLAEKSPASLQEARTLLEVLDEKMQEINRKNVRIDVLALLALVCDAQGDEQAALEKLAAALDLGMVGENVRCFADLGAPMAGLLRRLRQSDRGVSSDARPYVDRVLAAFEPAPKPEQPVTTSAATGSAAPSVFEEAGGLIEPLTRRELEVLALLAQQLTYREIAAELFIAHGTVGQHVVRIYQKLQVNDRREALAKALALGILPQQ
jgi:LuxR family maltose regulon positive regulatory protein